jgi:hypothetical protein
VVLENFVRQAKKTFRNSICEETTTPFSSHQMLVSGGAASAFQLIAGPVSSRFVLTRQFADEQAVGKAAR